MATATYIVAGVVLALVLLLASGWWRLALRPFGIRPDTMMVERLGLNVADEHVPRIDAVLAAFAGGFNRMLSSPSSSDWEHYCDSLPPLCQPFAHEGAAMGFTPRRLFRGGASNFERIMVQRHPGFCYLYYVGLGFWSGMRNHPPERMARLVAELDPLHGFLFYDGYGFKHGFFDYPKNEAALGKLGALDGYAVNAAYQGVGRAMFFYFQQRPKALIERLDKLGNYAADAASGVGLAAVFIFHDRLDVALEVAAAMPQRWHDQVHLGMCFGLKARSINDPSQFERDVGRLDLPVQEAVDAAVTACDKVEAHLRTERGEDSYRRWRASVTEWMANHIEYPLAGVRTGAEALYGQVATA
jgi:hypothetical protein